MANPNDLIPVFSPGHILTAKDIELIRQHIIKPIHQLNSLRTSSGMFIRNRSSVGGSTLRFGTPNVELASGAVDEDPIEITILNYNVTTRGFASVSETVEAYDLYGSGCIPNDLVEVWTTDTDDLVFRLVNLERLVKPLADVNPADTNAECEIWHQGVSSVMADTGYTLEVSFDWQSEHSALIDEDHMARCKFDPLKSLISGGHNEDQQGAWRFIGADCAPSPT